MRSRSRLASKGLVHQGAPLFPATTSTCNGRCAQHAFKSTDLVVDRPHIVRLLSLRGFSRKRELVSLHAQRRVRLDDR